jgi:hypothetical protein
LLIVLRKRESFENSYLGNDFSHDDDLFVGWDDPDLGFGGWAADQRSLVREGMLIELFVNIHAQALHAAAHFLMQFPGPETHIIGEDDRIRYARI